MKPTDFKFAAGQFEDEITVARMEALRKAAIANMPGQEHEGLFITQTDSGWVAKVKRGAIPVAQTKYPLKASTKSEDDELLATVEKGHILDYTQGQTPDVIDIDAFEGELTAAGTWLAYIAITVDYDEGKKVLSAETLLHQGEELPEPQDDEIFLLVARYEIESDDGALKVESIEQVQAGAIPYNVLPVWAKYDADEKRLFIGGDPDDPADVENAVIIEGLDLRVEKDGEKKITIGNDPQQFTFLQIGDQDGNLGNIIRLIENGSEGVPAIVLAVGNTTRWVIGETQEFNGPGFEVVSGDNYGILRQGAIDIKSAAGGELSIDADEIDGVMTVKKLTVNKGESSDEYQIISDDDIEIDIEEGEGVPWADFTEGNLSIGGSAPEETVENISIEATKTIDIDVGGLKIVGDADTAEFNRIEIGRVSLNTQDIAPVYIKGSGDNEASLATDGLEFTDGSKRVVLDLFDLPAEAEVKFRQFSVVMDNNKAGPAYFSASEPEEDDE